MVKDMDDKSNKLLSSLIAYRTYAKFLPTHGRREVLEETISRNMQMHLDKFPKLSRDIAKAYVSVFDGKCLGSLRQLQFSGSAIEKNNVRGYNCAFTYIDSVDAFGEILFLLLSGTGVGFSVQRRHVNQLPAVQHPREESIFYCGDSVSGWAEALDQLMKAYFYGRTRPQFDYSLIREKGSHLVSSGSKAPGPAPLKYMLEQVELKLKAAEGRRLRPLEAHDVVCQIADCVLAGGIRRAALISLFDKTDQEMLTCKSGQWWEKHPYRARANNSAIILRSSITKEEFRTIYDACISSNAGEPGISFTNNLDIGANPCIPGWSLLLTPQGLKELNDLGVGDEIWSGKRWTKIIAKWSTGIKPVYRYSTEKGAAFCTENHMVFQHGQRVEARLATHLDTCPMPEGFNLFGNKICPDHPEWASNQVIEYESSYPIIGVEYIRDEEVFDITVEAEEHSFWSYGVLISNCHEVALLQEFCNLSTVNQTTVTSKKDWLDRVYNATLLGTLQAAYTDFPYLRPQWKRNTEADALIGVSCTGIADAYGKISPEWLKEGAEWTVQVNEKYAKKIGILPAARTTVIKPEGSSSCVLGSSSGVHARHSDYYLRRVRMNKDDSLAMYLKATVPDLMEEDAFSANGAIIIIPQKSPEGAITRNVETARTLFERVVLYHSEWILPGHREGENTNNVSVTISYRPEEVEELFDLLWEYRNSYTGISLMPLDGSTYIQAPFEECSKEVFERYHEMVKDIDLTKVREASDMTDRSAIIACQGGFCESGV